MSDSKEQQLWDACTSGNLALVKDFSSDPAVNMNWTGPEKGDAVFHHACRLGHHEIVEFLLKHPRVEVTTINALKASPFCLASQAGHKEVVAVLLADLRIDVNTPTDQHTPLWFASLNGHLPVVQLILASGREIDTKTKSKPGTTAWSNTTAAEMARWSGSSGRWKDEKEESTARRTQSCPLIATLIDSYDRNPQQVRNQLRQQLGIKGKRLSFPSFCLGVHLIFFFW